MKKNSSKERLFEVMSRLDKTFKPQLNETTIKTKDGEEIDINIGSGRFLEDIHINDVSLDEMLDTPAGLEDAIGNFKSGKISLARYLEWMVEHRDEGITEETLQNNRLLRINIEELVKHYNKYKSEMGDDYSDYDIGEQKNMGRMMEDYDPNNQIDDSLDEITVEYDVRYPNSFEVVAHSADGKGTYHREGFELVDDLKITRDNKFTPEEQEIIMYFDNYKKGGLNQQIVDSKEFQDKAYKVWDMYYGDKTDFEWDYPEYDDEPPERERGDMWE